MCFKGPGSILRLVRNWGWGWECLVGFWGDHTVGPSTTRRATLQSGFWMLELLLALWYLLTLFAWLPMYVCLNWSIWPCPPFPLQLLSNPAIGPCFSCPAPEPALPMHPGTVPIAHPNGAGWGVQLLTLNLDVGFQAWPQTTTKSLPGWSCGKCCPLHTRLGV